MQIDALHQQRPVARWQRFEVTAPKWSVGKRPLLAFAHRETRLDVVARSKREQLRCVEHTAEARQRVADEKRLLVPEARDEGRRLQATEQCCALRRGQPPRILLA